MAIRTTSSAVGLIIEVDSAIDLSSFIETASALVDDVASNDSDGVLNSTRLELIERYLAAHCYTLRDPRPTSEKAGPVAASYQSKVDLGLKTSHYGQMAMTLDTTGYLSSIAEGGKTKVGVTWLGNTTDQGDVEDD